MNIVGSNKHARIIIATILGLVIVLVIVRAYLPIYIRDTLNEKLADLGEYKGHISDVDLHLWRAGVSFQGIEIIKKNAQIAAKLFEANQIEAGLLWSAILRLKVVAQIDFHNPKVNFVDDTDPNKQQSGKFLAEDLKEAGIKDDPKKGISSDKKIASWQEVVTSLYPVTIDRFEIHNGSVHFRNFESDPAVNIYLSDIDLTATNLTNSDRNNESLVSTIEMRAKAMNHAPFTVKAKVNALAKEPFFDLNAKLEKLDLKTLNSFTKHYAKFDFNKGTAQIISEIAMKDQKFKGYVKPLFHDLDVFDWKQDIKKDKDNPLVALWESIVGGAGTVVKNQRKDQLGTIVPIEGDLKDPDTDIYTVMITTLKNGFVAALIPNFENTININSVKEVKRGT